MRRSLKLFSSLSMVAALTFALPSAADDMAATPAPIPADIQSVLDRPRVEPPAAVNYRYVMEVTATYAEARTKDAPEDGQPDLSARETATAHIMVDATQPPGERAEVLFRDDDREGLAHHKDLRKMIDGVVEGIEDKDNTPERMAQSFYCTLDAETFEVGEHDGARVALHPDAPSMAQAMAEGGDGSKRFLRRLSERLDGEIVIAREDGRVMGSRFVLNRPMKVYMIANIRAMELTQSCTRAPDGHMRSETLDMATDVTAMGKTMHTGMRMVVRDVVPAG